MKVIVRIFGRYRQITGKDKIQLDITDGNTLRDVVNTFVKQYPAVKIDKSRIMVIKNKMYSSYDATITEEDEISLSPPVVSGG
ncbi:MAG: MoaD/ThiS family protein [Candidatus Thermoplasmatota archaeon]|nr:MoaD/ThiS family protein [Candidatus Thermoplasmatota archaeon]